MRQYLDANVHDPLKVAQNHEDRLDILERALGAYLSEGRDANFAAREAALKIINEEQ